MKKRLIYIGTTIVALFGLSACDHTNPKSKDMEQGKDYKMTAGDKIVRTQKPTTIKLETDIKSGETTATLISGGAKIE